MALEETEERECIKQESRNSIGFPESAQKDLSAPTTTIAPLPDRTTGEFSIWTDEGNG